MKYIYLSGYDDVPDHVKIQTGKRSFDASMATRHFSSVQRRGMTDIARGNRSQEVISRYIDLESNQEMTFEMTLPA